MIRFARAHLTYANVTATLALFVALGGGAYAALRVPKHSVGTAQLRHDAVISSKVKNHSLRAIDFAKGQLPAGPQGPKGDTGAQGPKGDTGAQGPKGDTGAAGTARAYAYVYGGVTASFDSARTKGFTAVSRVGAQNSGVYCLTPDSGIDLSTTAVAVTPVWNSGIINNAFAQLREDGLCASNQLEVVTYFDGGMDPTFTDGLSFTVVVP